MMLTTEGLAEQVRVLAARTPGAATTTLLRQEDRAMGEKPVLEVERQPLTSPPRALWTRPRGVAMAAVVVAVIVTLFIAVRSTASPGHSPLTVGSTPSMTAPSPTTSAVYGQWVAIPGLNMSAGAGRCSRRVTREWCTRLVHDYGGATTTERRRRSDLA